MDIIRYIQLVGEMKSSIISKQPPLKTVDLISD